MPTNVVSAVLYRVRHSLVPYCWLAVAMVVVTLGAWSGVNYVHLAELYMEPAAQFANEWIERVCSANTYLFGNLVMVFPAVCAIQMYCDGYDTGFVKNLLSGPAGRVSYTAAHLVVLVISLAAYLLLGIAIQAVVYAARGMPAWPLFTVEMACWYVQTFAGAFAMGCVALLIAHLCRNLTASIALFLFHGTIISVALEQLNRFEPLRPLLETLLTVTYCPDAYDVWYGAPVELGWLVLVVLTVGCSIATMAALARWRDVA